MHASPFPISLVLLQFPIVQHPQLSEYLYDSSSCDIKNNSIILNFFFTLTHHIQATHSFRKCF